MQLLVYSYKQWCRCIPTRMSWNLSCVAVLSSFIVWNPEHVQLCCMGLTNFWTCPPLPTHTLPLQGRRSERRCYTLAAGTRAKTTSTRRSWRRPRGSRCWRSSTWPSPETRSRRYGSGGRRPHAHPYTQTAAYALETVSFSHRCTCSISSNRTRSTSGGWSTRRTLTSTSAGKSTTATASVGVCVRARVHAQSRCWFIFTLEGRSLARSGPSIFVFLAGVQSWSSHSVMS